MDGGDGRWWIVTNEHGCESARAPTKADRPDAEYEDESIAPIYLALSRVLLGATDDDEALTENPDAWRDIGFDRDGRCTSSPTCEVDNERVDEPSCTSGVGTPAEGNYCIDNVMGSLLTVGMSITAPGSPFGPLGMTAQDWNCELRRGGFSMILKISDYNGSENDPLVRLDMYVSTGLQELAAWSCRTTIESPLREDWYDYPRWLPGQHWKIAKRSVPLSAVQVGNEVPDSNTYDSAAFVRSGYLFAELPDGREFTFAGERTPIPGFRNIMHNPVFVAKLIQDPDDKAWRMEDGVLSFFVLPGEFMQTFREVGFCENVCGYMEVIRNYVNSAKDVLLTGESIPNVPCDALSLAAKFEAYQATATAEDVEEIAEPVDCPPPRHPDIPPHGCVCQDDGTCVLPDGGEPDGGEPDGGIPDSAT